MSSTVTVPTLARIDATGASLSGATLTLTSPVWADFLDTPTLTYTLSQAALVVRSNTSFNVGIMGGTWTQPGATNRVVGDISYEAVSGACGDQTVSGYATALTGASVTAFSSGSASSSFTRNLCLALVFPGDLADPKLTPGAYTLPITLTLTAP
jgi:hypothetical protein